MTPEHLPAQLRDLAINQAVVQSVENWLNGDMEGANRCFEMAITFKDAPLSQFQPYEETHV